MKLRRAAWCALLLASHVAVFLAARPADSPASVREGEAGSQASAVTPAKASDRSHGGGRPDKTASAHAGLLAELNASDLKDEAYENARTAIFRDWIKRDLRGALGAIYGPQAGTRHASMADRLEEELDRELLARGTQVGGWISSGCFGSRHAEVAELWAKALVKGGQREVLVAALPDLPGGSRVVAIDELCRVAKGPELAILRHWMSPESQQNLEEYAQRVVRFAGDDPERVFANEDNDEVVEALCKAYKECYLSHVPPQQAVAALGKLPEATRLEMLADIASLGDIGHFTTLLAEMDRQGLSRGISGEEEEDLAKSAIQEICNDYSLPHDVFHELSGVARPGTRLAALRSAGEKIVGAALMTDAVSALPRGAELDAFMEGMVGEDGSAIPTGCWPFLLERVSNAGLRERMKEMQAERGEEEEGG